MAIRRNSDGSITVGILPEEKKEKPAEKPSAAPQAAKKPAKKTK